MPSLQATRFSDGTLFLWSWSAPIGEAVEREWPALLTAQKSPAVRVLASPEPGEPRQSVTGWTFRLHDLLPHLAALPTSSRVSLSLWCWARAAQLALELVTAHQTAPRLVQSRSRWQATLTRADDRERLRVLADTLPNAARCEPATATGAVRLRASEQVLRDFIDDVADVVSRSGAHPGTARGWPLALAQSLRRGNGDLVLLDARWQAVPRQLEHWSDAARSGALSVGFRLRLPSGNEAAFPLSLFVRAPGASVRMPISEAWKAGPALLLGGRSWRQPALQIMQDLARAARLHPPLAQAIDGQSPHDLVMDAKQAWALIDRGRRTLDAAGIEVLLPDEFARTGAGRVTARMVIEGGDDLAEALSFRWEVRLGDTVLDGKAFAGLLKRREPIVLHEGRWILLDPDDVAKLPADLTQGGVLEPAVALRAVLLGEYEGVPVVADDRLELILEALRNPRERDVPPDFVGTLRAYQHRGLSWLGALGDLGLGCALADDMGLGKTVQLIAHMLDRRTTATAPSLVVCPTSVLGNWRRELARFAPTLRVVVYHGPNRQVSTLDNVDVVVTSYGIMANESATFEEREWDVTALDEAQSIKNPDSRRAKSARALTARHRVAMSGTPVENRLDELWSLFAFMVPGLLGSRASFRRDVAIPVERFGDDDVAEGLRKGVAPFILRRLKSDPDIAPDLPEKIEKVEWTALTSEQRSLYKTVTEDHLAELEAATPKERRGKVFALLTALKQVCNHPAHFLKDGSALPKRSGKLERLDELVDNIMEADEQVLVFTQYRVMGELLATHLSKRLKHPVPFLHGGTSVDNRERMVASVQAKECPVLLISLKAGGTGLNLTGANHVVHYDRWWNPAVEDQATDRAYRIGQRSDVMVHKMVTEGTLEERIDQLLIAKRELAESVVGAGEHWLSELDDGALRRLVMLTDGEGE